jgi:hypothetical protein
LYCSFDMFLESLLRAREYKKSLKLSAHMEESKSKILKTDRESYGKKLDERFSRKHLESRVLYRFTEYLKYEYHATPYRYKYKYKYGTEYLYLLWMWFNVLRSSTTSTTLFRTFFIVVICSRILTDG